MCRLQEYIQYELPCGTLSQHPHGMHPLDNGQWPDCLKLLILKKDPRSRLQVKNVQNLHNSLNVFSKDIPGVCRSLLKALNAISEKHTTDT